MSIIILTLFSYIFNPSVTELEQNKLVQKFNISFAIKRTPKINFKEKDLINLYNLGKYQKYIYEFEKNIKNFIYVKNDNINYSQLYLYYTLSLKILSKIKNYKKSLCVMKNSLNSFKNLPKFIINEIPKKCNNLKEISITGQNKDINIYINGLKADLSLAYVDNNSYNLTICNKNECKYLRSKSSELNKDKYNDYFTWKIKKGLYIAKTIPDSFFQYYNVKQIHYFYKKNKKLFHKVKLNNGVIILEEKIVLSDNKKNNLLVFSKKNKKKIIPIYKKWYFYAGAIAIIGITAGGVYWSQQGEETNTSISWQ